MEKHESVDAFIQSRLNYKEEIIKLREIILATDLKETVKWSMPVYVDQKKNIVGIFSSKAYFGLWFYNGVFLKDEAGVLINAQEGKTQALRQWRMHSFNDIDVNTISKYIHEAIANQRAGLEFKPHKKAEMILCKELKALFKENTQLKLLFNEFPLYKQREFNEHIETAKRTATKKSRLEKIVPMIRRGEGLSDRYRTKK